jgi:hypothetical protein
MWRVNGKKGYNHYSHAKISGSAHVRNDLGSLRPQMGHDLQPCPLHHLGAGNWVHKNFVGVLGGSRSLWYRNVSREPKSVSMDIPADGGRGGLYGPAAATALEDLPYDARGILSGLYQVC